MSSIDWAGWFNNPGMPPYKPKYDDSLAVACKALKDKWVSWDGQGDAPSPVGEWNALTSAQKVEFLSLLLAEKEPLRYEGIDAGLGVGQLTMSSTVLNWVAVAHLNYLLTPRYQTRKSLKN